MFALDDWLLIKAEQKEIFLLAPVDFDPGHLCDHDDEEYFELLENGMFDDESETAQKGYDNLVAIECDLQDIRDCAEHLEAVPL